MKITISFNTDNESFKNGEDSVNTMLDQVKRKVNKGHTSGNLQDINGNTVGRFAGVEPYEVYGEFESDDYED